MADERSDGASTRDEFEAKEMLDGSPVVHRDKRVARSMTGILLAPGVFTLFLAGLIPFINPGSDKPLPDTVLPFVVGGLLLYSVLSVVLAVSFGVLRTLVTEKALHIKYGLWGPTIDLASIREVRVKPYDWTEFGGWGIRRGHGGTWAYVATGSGDVVEVEYVDAGGAPKKVLVGPEDARAVARAIDRARGKPELRIAEFESLDATPPSRDEADREIEALAEREAELLHARKKRTLP